MYYFLQYGVNLSILLQLWRNVSKLYLGITTKLRKLLSCLKWLIFLYLDEICWISLCYNLYVQDHYQNTWILLRISEDFLDPISENCIISIISISWQWLTTLHKDHTLHTRLTQQQKQGNLENSLTESTTVFMSSMALELKGKHLSLSARSSSLSWQCIAYKSKELFTEQCTLYLNIVR